MLAKNQYLRIVRRTALLNASSTILGAGTGVLLARLLGPSGRGDYAAVFVVFSFSLVLFELGLPASLVYFNAKDRSRTGIITGTTAIMLLPLGLLAGGAVALLSLTSLGQPGGRAIGLLVAALIVVISFLGAPAVFGLQALNIQRWNAVRLLQPLAFCIIIVAAMTVTTLSVPFVMVAFGATVLLQCSFAWVLYARETASRLSASPGEARALVRFGVANLASTAPNNINARFDQLVLALMVSSASLGQYAVAVSLSVLVTPLAAAFGNVAFPRIADGRDSLSIQKTAIRGVWAVGLVGVGLVTASAPVLVPRLYGPDFGNVPALLVVLAPGAVFFLANQVVGDLLRGLGRPGLVAAGEWTGVVITVVGLVTLVPTLGSFGAAITSSLAYALVHLVLWTSLRKLRHAELVAIAAGVLPNADLGTRIKEA